MVLLHISLHPLFQIPLSEHIFDLIVQLSPKPWNRGRNPNGVHSATAKWNCSPPIGYDQNPDMYTPLKASIENIYEVNKEKRLFSKPTQLSSWQRSWQEKILWLQWVNWEWHSWFRLIRIIIIYALAFWFEVQRHSVVEPIEGNLCSQIIRKNTYLFEVFLSN